MNGYYGYAYPQQPPPPQKNVLKHLALGVLFPVIHMGVMFFVQIVAQLIMTVGVMSTLGDSVSETALENELTKLVYTYAEFLNAISNIMTVLVVILIFVLINRSREKKGTPVLSAKEHFALKKVKPTLLLKVALLAFFFYHIVSIVLALIGALVPSWMENYNDAMEYMEVETNWFWTFIAVVVMAPITEELIYRNRTIDEMRKGISPALAVTLSAIIFGVVHGNFLQILYAAGLGFMFGYLYTRFDSIWPSMVGHAVFNFFGFTYSVLNDVATKRLDVNPDDGMMVIIETVILIVGIASLVLGPLTMYWVTKSVPKQKKEELKKKDPLFDSPSVNRGYGMPYGGTPYGGTPYGGTPYGGMPYGGTPYGGMPYGGTPYGGMPYGGMPYGGTPYGGTPYGGMPYGGMPYGGTPYGGAPYGGTPYGGMPYGGTPYGGAQTAPPPNPNGRWVFSPVSGWTFIPHPTGDQAGNPPVQQEEIKKEAPVEEETSETKE